MLARTDPARKVPFRGSNPAKGNVIDALTKVGGYPMCSIVNDPSISAKGRKAKLIDESGVNV